MDAALYVARVIYVDKNKEDGDFYDSKKLWALGNFSRFVRPGLKRVEVMVRDVINLSGNDREIDLEKKGSMEMYTTSAAEKLFRRVMRAGEEIVVHGRSVNTLVIRP